MSEDKQSIHRMEKVKSDKNESKMYWNKLSKYNNKQNGMRSSWVVRASDSKFQSRNCPFFSIPASSDRHSEISEGRQITQCLIQ